ncbi:MAG: RidA family protein [Polyangiales bacterium]
MLVRINPETIHAPAPSYCQVLEDRARGIVYVAGQVGFTPQGELAGRDMATQTRQALANFDAILAALGLDRTAFARRTVFVTDMDEYFTEAVNGAITEYFRAAPCPSTLVGVASLFRPEVKIEIEATLHRASP